MKITCIMATCGRHKLAERSLRFFLDQDYKGEHTLLIYNNSDVPINKLDVLDNEFSLNKKIILANKPTDVKYDNLGQIYTDALKLVPEDTDVIIHWDDDDIFLPNHISEGVKGLQRAKQISLSTTLIDMNSSEEKQIVIDYRAYKPERSYYRHPGGIELMGNNLEPSVFVSANHIRHYGYSNTTTDQHLQWFGPLLAENKMLIDKDGKPTLIYNWGDTDIPTFKTSGNAGHPNNFKNYRDFSRDHGDQILTPWPKENVQKYYDLVYG